MDNGHWDFPEQMGGKEYIGFIYVIHDPLFGEFYIGKKHYRTAGKNNYGLQSDWKSYVSSSKWMQKITAEGSLKSFDFIVLEQYKAKGMLTYAETWSLCAVEAPTRKDCHSKRIEKVQWKVSENITERHKLRMSPFTKTQEKT